ncbi:MAG: DedA family protein [Alphaproteobacteria bacterium]|nr:DedA family protein [Alphaproteobacteria bacterium]
MKIFSPMYERIMHYSKHPKAPWYLFALSFAESSFFVIPPDVMLAPMCMAKPRKAMRLAFITTLASILGGILGYLIGFFAFSLIEDWLMTTSYWDSFQAATVWFENWGFWAVFLSGFFTPIPYKIFTIAAGAMRMAFWPFFLASILSRGSRFFIVAALMSYGGRKMEHVLKKYIDIAGWVTVGFIVIVILIYEFW